jgi:hypothetical protein
VTLQLPVKRFAPRLVELEVPGVSQRRSQSHHTN